MRFLWLAVAAVFSASASAASPHLHNDAMAFAEFWDANHDQPPAAQVAAFKTTVAPTFPAFYKAERFQSFLTPAQYDERIAKAIQEFPTIRTAYVRNYANIFLGRGKDALLPRRRRYYLGFLVAQEAGKTRDVRQLANMTCDEVKPLVFSTVHRLRENAR